MLVTDGANTAGVVAPRKAAELAGSAGLKIYTIGIGADDIQGQGGQGLPGARRVNSSRDIDEGTLTEIAGITGGRYFRARDTVELQRIYALLDELEPVVQEPLHFRPMKALFVWPLGASVLFSGLLLALLARGQRGP